MKRKILIVLLTIVLILSVSGVGCNGCIYGSGKLVTENYEYVDFTMIEAGNGCRVNLTRSSSFSVEISIDDNIHEYLEVEQSGDTLKIGLEQRAFGAVTLKANISMPEMAGINLSRGSLAEISGFTPSNDFSATLSEGSILKGEIITGDIGFGLSGGSKVSLTGSATNLMARSSGGSEMMLDSFPVNNADINIDGGGTAYINVRGILDTTLTGGSELVYTGEPEMGEVNISSGSTLRKR